MLIQLQNILHRFAKEIIQDIKQAQITAGKKATGKSADALTYEVYDKGLKIIDPLGYIIYQEYGRGPGKPPPINALREWCIAKGLDIKIAWAVRYNIAKFGTLTFQKKAPRLRLAEILSEIRVKELSNEISKYSGLTIKETIIKNLK